MSLSSLDTWTAFSALPELRRWTMCLVLVGVTFLGRHPVALLLSGKFSESILLMSPMLWCVCVAVCLTERPEESKEMI